jgi:hypothetical protein
MFKTRRNCGQGLKNCYDKNSRGTSGVQLPLAENAGTKTLMAAGPCPLGNWLKSLVWAVNLKSLPRFVGAVFFIGKSKFARLYSANFHYHKKPFSADWCST